MSRNAFSAATRPPRPTRRTRGFTLIEALVTLVILSIGVLALTVLQMQTLLDGRTAAMRNIATVMAYNLADQIRGNEIATKAGTYNLPTAQSTPACYTAAGCPTDAMARSSFQDWTDDVAAALPAGTGTVCVDSTPDDGTGPAAPACDNQPGAPYVIKIWWHEDKGATQRFVTALVP
ncbi:MULTISPECIES: type IV pilus modification protein PilV [Cupriavidus]